MEFYDKTLEIRKENLSSTNKSIVATYYSISKLFHKQAKYNQALDIYRKVLPSKHPSIYQIEEDILTLKKDIDK